MLLKNVLIVVESIFSLVKMFFFNFITQLCFSNYSTRWDSAGGAAVGRGMFETGSSFRVGWRRAGKV